MSTVQHHRNGRNKGNRQHHRAKQRFAKPLYVSIQFRRVRTHHTLNKGNPSAHRYNANKRHADCDADQLYLAPSCRVTYPNLFPDQNAKQYSDCAEHNPD